MANIKSQIKRDRTSLAASKKNSAFKAEVRTASKKVRLLVEAGKKSEAEAALKEAFALLDQSAQARVISPNAVARQKSHLQKLVSSIK